MADGGRLLIVWVLRTMPYAEYLQTNWWRDYRQKILREEWRCKLCPGRAVDCHHMNYENRGDEQPGDVIPLCRKCHKVWHETWIHRSHAEGEWRFGG